VYNLDQNFSPKWPSTWAAYILILLTNLIEMKRHALLHGNAVWNVKIRIEIKGNVKLVRGLAANYLLI
jgi:hypothetical protein